MIRRYVSFVDRDRRLDIELAALVAALADGAFNEIGVGTDA